MIPINMLIMLVLEVQNKTESHFRLEIVSDVFEGKSLPARHRLVYSLLANELKNDGVHALQMKTKTPEEIKQDSKLNQ